MKLQTPFSLSKLHPLFFFFGLCWVFVVVHGLSPAAVSGGYSLVAVPGVLIAIASLVSEHGL